MRFILMLAFVLVLTAHVCVCKDLRSVGEEKNIVEKESQVEKSENEEVIKNTKLCYDGCCISTCSDCCPSPNPEFTECCNIDHPDTARCMTPPKETL